MFFESQSSFSASRSGCTYDVFLSFRGEDTRKNFTDHLYAALVQAGIYTFQDYNEVPRGEEISQELTLAIQKSRISIVVFSKGYASSTWCLDELEKIMECRNTKGQTVLPIFYGIDPSSVRKQKRSFAKAFQTHEEFFKEEIEKVNRWRKALKDAANVSGWNLNDMANGHESKFIQKIVEDVLEKLDGKCLHFPKHLVGIDSRVKNVIARLRIQTNGFRIVGIHGMAGIGKTTIAKVAFYQLCCEFEGSCFLLNIKEKSEQPNGLVQLQEQLCFDVLKTAWNIYNVDIGINLIKERLCQKRVLIVLDDVDRLEQLDALVGKQSSFGERSRIIITTRNERLLTQFEVDEKFEVQGLNQDESFQLFCWHAFWDTHPMEGFLELSHEVVCNSGGLPLALEVLGSYLFRRSIHEWRDAIEKLRRIPHQHIQRKLRISFDTLDDDKLKGIFLDIACFFIGHDKEYVLDILDSHGFFPKIGINILIERSLLTVNVWNQLEMHDLLRDMGREIIREMSPDHPGNRSRIWFSEDVFGVLKRQTGTELVDGLAIDIRSTKNVSLSTKSFSKMKFLKLLQINGVKLVGFFKLLSKELIWLCWHECPLTSLPSNFELDNLVVLDMQHSKIKELKILKQLKILNLSYSIFAKTPNFLGLLSLESLILAYSTNLVEVHQSIGYLESLVTLNLEGCCRLKNLPESMCNLKSLGTLNIISCSQFEKLPEHLGDMESLTELLADGTAIMQLPSSIRRLKKLRKLSLSGCNYKRESPPACWLSLFSSCFSPRSSISKSLLPASFFGLSSLRKLDLSYCDLSEDIISTEFGILSSLQEMNLSGNEFFNLPSSIGLLPKLETLSIKECKNLVSISELPSSLIFLAADNCTSLERVRLPPIESKELFIGWCQNLREIQGMEGLGNSWALYTEDCNSLSNNFKRSLVQELCKGKHYDMMVAVHEIPEWFSHHGEGLSLSFQVPVAFSDGNKLQALVVWVVCVVKESSTRGEVLYAAVDATLKRKRNSIHLLESKKVVAFKTYTNKQYYSWIKHITLTGLPCDIDEELELSVELDVHDISFAKREKDITVEKYGVHVIVKKAAIDGKQEGRRRSAVITPYHHYPESSSSTNDELWESYLIRTMPESRISFANRD